MSGSLMFDSPSGQSNWNDLMNYGKTPSPGAGFAGIGDLGMAPTMPDTTGQLGNWGSPVNPAGNTGLSQYGGPELTPAVQDATGAKSGWDSFWGGALSKANDKGATDQGWAGPALGAVQGAANLFMGMKQYGLAKQQLAQSQQHYEQQYNAQKQMTNTRMEDRQKARVSANPGGYESVDSYMKKNAIQ